ncbi:GNAT family N-acetyltransferase [Candidatus Solirubrobacter pratensis]|uniref:GNAT family N-acetyltransferase n=1 Tax=Candidatus Solirubrobacter pratensis TaxID=1298857 RepID=UPI000687FE3E|nr:GNAT family N-acetyltransferase [Candidatus Solirubrobacter pratensis]
MIAELTEMINAAYAAGEEGLWRPGTPRVFEQDVRAMLEAGELLTLERDGELAGSVRVRQLDAQTAELGILSAARDGSGAGRELVARAEDWARGRGLTGMRLQLLVPREGTHPFKQRLHDWYRRLGYRVIGRRDFAEVLPEPATYLLAPCDLVDYEKAL